MTWRIAFVPIVLATFGVASCRCSGQGNDVDASARAHAYQHISDTSLFTSVATKKVSDDVTRYDPAYGAWADGLEQTRWVHLPKGAKIDTSSPDHWQFPVGTAFYQELAIHGKRLETRVIERIAATDGSEKDFFAGSFVWRDDGSDADLRPAGSDAGSDDSVPECWACHKGEPGKILGFSAVGLAPAKGELSLSGLAAGGRLSSPPPPPTANDGADETAKEAVGYLHSNCGPCHNPNGMAWANTSMNLRMSSSEATTDMPAYKTTVLVALERFKKTGYSKRVVPRHPEESALLYRMTQHEGVDAMPPTFVTKKADDAGIALITKWIAGLGER